MIHDIQAAIGRLVSKVTQLIGNETTNLAECWMHIRTKFEGGKVINRSQSGSWEHRSIGAGLQQNLGKEWGPTVWTSMTNSAPNPVFATTVKLIAKRTEYDSKRKAKDEVEAKRRRGKYSRVNNSVAARKAYNRHDNGVEPDDVTDDVSPELFDEMKQSYFEINVAVSKEEVVLIEAHTRDQAGNNHWKEERRMCLTASRVGSVSKMKKKPKEQTK